MMKLRNTLNRRHNTVIENKLLKEIESIKNKCKKQKKEILELNREKFKETQN